MKQEKKENKAMIGNVLGKRTKNRDITENISQRDNLK